MGERYMDTYGDWVEEPMSPLSVIIPGYIAGLLISAAYAGVQAHLTNKENQLLADGLQQNNLMLSLKTESGRQISLNHPLPEDQAILNLLSTKGRSSEMPVMREPSREDAETSSDKHQRTSPENLTLTIASATGQPICKIPFGTDRLTALLNDGKLYPKLHVLGEANIERLGNLCGKTEAEIKQMKRTISIGSMTPAVEPAGPYSVATLNDAVAMGTLAATPTILR